MLIWSCRPQHQGAVYFQYRPDAPADDPYYAPITEDAPDLPPGNQTHWGSGYGIYFDRDDVWVSPSDSGEVSGAKADEAAARDKADAKRGKS